MSLGSELSSVVRVGMRWGTEDASCKDVENMREGSPPDYSSCFSPHPNCRCNTNKSRDSPS